MVMDRTEYVSKAADLLSDTDTYGKLSKYPTGTCKSKLIDLIAPINTLQGLGLHVPYHRLFGQVLRSSEDP